MHNNNVFDLLIAVIFTMSPQIGVLGTKAQYFLIPFRLGEVETLPYFHLRDITIRSVTAWANGFDPDTSVFSMIGITGSIPKFRNPENFRKGRLECSGPSAVADFHATG